MDNNQNARHIPCIDFLGSEGLEIDLIYNGNCCSNVIPRSGHINQYDVISPHFKHCVSYLNAAKRLTHPLKKTKNGFEEISFDEAFGSIEVAIRNVEPNENAFFAGARLNNEAMYLIQKWARAGVKSNNIGSFHYFGRDADFYDLDKNDNVQFDEIEHCDAVILLGSAFKEESAMVETIIRKIRKKHSTPIILINKDCNDFDQQYFTRFISVDNFYYFIKSVIYYIIANDLQQGIFVQALAEQFSDYKNKILSEDFSFLLQHAGVSEAVIHSFVASYFSNKKTIIIYSEKETTSHTARELLNLSLLSERLGFPFSGVLSLKEKNNAQGLFDMGINPHFGIGKRNFSTEFIEELKKVWNIPEIELSPIDHEEYLISGKSKNLFIFGEDPIGCACRKKQKKLLEKAQFIVVQDYFMTETASHANIVLPDTLPFETGGSFTNTTKILQLFSKEITPPVQLNQLEQLSQLCSRFGLVQNPNSFDIFMELSSFFIAGCHGGSRHKFVYTENDSALPLFAGGCDDLFKKCKR